MATLDQIHDKVEQLRGELAIAIAAQKLSPKQITIVNGLSDINNSLGIVRAGQFFALSDGEDPQDSNGTGTFISAQGRTFDSKLYHIGGVKDGDLKWGANALTGELEAGDGAVNLTSNGVSIYDGLVEVGRFGNLNGFLDYSSDAYGFAMGDSDQYMTYDQTNGLKIYGALTSDREILTANRTYYVATTGSNSNNGLTAGTPFATVEYAIQVISSQLDVRSYNVTIQVANGTYTITSTIFFLPLLGDGSVIIIGDETTPSNVIFEMANGVIFYNYNYNYTTYFVRGIKIQKTGASSWIYGMWATEKSFIGVQNVEFGDAGTGAHMYARETSWIRVVGNYTISGPASFHVRVNNNANISLEGPLTVTITGTPALGEGAYVSLLSRFSALNVTYSGGATGRRYYVALNSVISTGSSGATYLPGDSAGATATGGIYD